MAKVSLLREVGKLFLLQGQIYGYVRVCADSIRLARRHELLRLAGKPVLLIAPHPDDDVFGAGGTLATLSDLHCPITILYLTDGIQGTVEAHVDRSLKELRRAEAIEALRFIAPGCRTIFWDEPDGSLSVSPKLTAALSDVMEEIHAAAIFYPNLLEAHPDHAAVTPMLLATLAQVNFSGLLWGYEIWTPAPINTTIDITPLMERKRAAMDCHRSQLLSRPYRSIVEGLNSYRAGVQNIAGYAEAFMVTTQEQLKYLFELKQQASFSANSSLLAAQLRTEAET